MHRIHTHCFYLTGDRRRLSPNPMRLLQVHAPVQLPSGWISVRYLQQLNRSALHARLGRKSFSLEVKSRTTFSIPADSSSNISIETFERGILRVRIVYFIYLYKKARETHTPTEQSSLRRGATHQLVVHDKFRRLSPAKRVSIHDRGTDRENELVSDKTKRMHRCVQRTYDCNSGRGIHGEHSVPAFQRL